MTGRDLQDAVVEAARLLGWKAVHFRASRTTNGWRTAVAHDGAGWPDLTLVRECIIFCEIRGSRDTIRPDQAAWLSRLEHAGFETYVWAPSDWTAGRVDEVLR